MRVALIAVLAVLVASAAAFSRENCAADRLHDLNGELSWKTVGSTDPNVPFDSRLYDFNFFSQHTPHGDLPWAQTDRIHNDLCSGRSVNEVLGEHDAFVDAEEEPKKCKDDPSRTCTKGEDSCGSNGFDADQCDAGYFCCKKARRATNAGQVGFNGNMGVNANNDGLAQGETKPANLPPALVPLPSSSFSVALGDLPIPFPVLPVVKLTLSVSVDAVSSQGFVSISGKHTLKFAFDIKVFKMYVYISLAGFISGSTTGGRAPGFAGTAMTSALYAAYGSIGKISELITKVADGLTGAAGSANTPTRPSTILNLYAQGFHKEYIESTSDEWNYVTGSAGDKEFTDSLSLVERMMEKSPKQLDDNSLLWEHAGIKVRMMANREWKWSMDGQTLTPVTSTKAVGGRDNGKSPSSDGVALIKALKVVYVDHAKTQAMLEVDDEWGCDCKTNPQGAVCSRYCATADWAGKQVDGAKKAVGQAYDATAKAASNGVKAVGQAYDATKKAVVDGAKAVGQAYDATKKAVVDGANALREFGAKVLDKITDFGKRMLDGAKRNLAELKKTIKETGVYRALDKAVFNRNPPKKPGLVFSELAERMRVEGFTDGDNKLEKVLFLVDAAIFKDYTRVLSFREAIMAYCMKNKEQADKMKDRIAEVMKGRDSRQAEGMHTGQHQMNQQAGPLFEPNMEGIRMDKVQQQLNEKDKGPTASVDAAKQLYAALGPEIASRYEHIRQLALAQAERLKKLNNPLWTNLTPQQQTEYRNAFQSIRTRLGELHTLFKELNQGDGFFKRTLLSGVKYVKTEVEKIATRLKESLKAKITSSGTAIGFGLSLEIGAGAATDFPKTVTAFGGEAKIEVGAIAGVFGAMEPSAFTDPKKTYFGKYAGFLGSLSGTFTRGTSKFTATISGNYLKPDAAICNARYGGSPCTEVTMSGALSFPNNLGMTQATLRSAFALALGVAIGNNEGSKATNMTATHALGGLLRHLLPKSILSDGGAGGASTSAPGDLTGSLNEVKNILMNYGLPLIVAFKMPGTLSFKLSISKTQYWVTKGGKTYTGYRYFTIGPSFSTKSTLGGVVAETLSKFPGAKVDISGTTGFSYDLKKGFPKLAEEQAALEVDDDAFLGTQSSSCDPIKLIEQLHTIRQSLDFARQDSTVKHDLLKTLADMEALCANINTDSS